MFWRALVSVGRACVLSGALKKFSFCSTQHTSIAVAAGLSIVFPHSRLSGGKRLCSLTLLCWFILLKRLALLSSEPSVMPLHFSASLVKSKTSARIIEESWLEPLPLMNRFKLKGLVFLHYHLNCADKLLSLIPLLFIRKIKYNHFRMGNGQALRWKLILKISSRNICNMTYKNSKRADKMQNVLNF